MKKTNVFVIVPVKDLATSKERLYSMLSPEERRALTVAMLEDVLNALESSIVREVLVVSSDSTIRQIANKRSFHISPQEDQI